MRRAVRMECVTRAGLCEIIADRSAATAGDVKLVLDGLLFVVKQSYRTGRADDQRVTGLFPGCAKGKTLLELAKKLKVERVALDKNEPDSGSGSGGGDRPEIE